MNTDPEKLRVLLDDVLTASSDHCGPSSAELLSMLRNERQRRHRRHTGAALLAMIAVAAVALWQNEPTVVAPVADTPVNPEPITIRRVNDEELFTLLQGTPTAVMKLPDGGYRLLVISESFPSPR